MSAMNKLWHPTHIFLPIANTSCNKLAPILYNMEAVSTFVTKIALVKLICINNCECSCCFSHLVHFHESRYADNYA